MKKEYDAIVIGAGHNGLVCACYLAKAGLKTLVVEAYHSIGGLSATEEITLPGFHSDIHAYGYQFANLSPAITELNLQNIEFITPPIPFAHVFPDGSSLHMDSHLEGTLENIAKYSSKDASQWKILFNRWLQQKKAAIIALNSPPLPLSAHLKHLETTVEGLDEYRFEMQSLRSWCDYTFEAEQCKCFFGIWAMHGNLGVDDVGGGRLAWLFASIIQDYGNKIIKGGMSQIVKSLAQCLQSLNGEVITHSRVKKILVHNGKANALQLENDNIIEAKQLIASSIDPKTLTLNLLGEDLVGEHIARKIKQYEWGPSIMVIYIALNGPLEFFAGEKISGAAYVHASPPTLDYAAQMMVECRAGLLPFAPVIIVCNDYKVDSSRVPSGKGLIKILVKNVPYHIKGDAARKIDTTHWDDAKEAYADRVIDILHRHYIPNIKQRILKRVVHSPVDQERKISSAIYGTELQGAFLPYQSGPFRPIPELAQYRSPVPNVYLCGSSSYPGPGVSFMPGRNAAQMIYKDLGIDFKSSLEI